MLSLYALCHNILDSFDLVLVDMSWGDFAVCSRTDTNVGCDAWGAVSVDGCVAIVDCL